ncbi:MAG: NAD(P)/FAD-dependent oxidoreductase [Gammaproteobacteria bacterium]|nr:NAD(P)/FAD-dependent oxidoreductase [Gammaproteobacteria bacterium]
MESSEVLIVGGGPAGSSCAWKLARHGVDCRILDAQSFPRTKLCAGWITPEVVGDLEIDVRSYPHRFLSFDRLYFHLFGIGLRVNSLQHSIRRFEFDDWLLKRSGVPVETHNVRDIRREGEYYVIDDRYRARYLIGAGGTKCPVYRSLFRAANPRAKELQTVTLEQEFPYEYQDGGCHLWFFERGFPGYSWYVPKADGYLNVGIGGMASQLKHRGEDIWSHWEVLTRRLMRSGMVRAGDFDPKGYSYYLRSEVRVGRIDNAFIVGDSAGLATRDLCEGIGPAVRSGLMAADAILTGADYSLAAIRRYTSDRGIVHRSLEFMFIERERRRLARFGAAAAL